MARVYKRNIEVLKETYIWTLKNSTIDCKETYIRVFKKGYKNSILYIDPYNYNFEIKPKTIKDAIIFAINNNWKPEINNNNLYIGMKEEEFIEITENTFIY